MANIVGSMMVTVIVAIDFRYNIKVADTNSPRISDNNAKKIPIKTSPKTRGKGCKTRPI